jgi:glycosyltransferase involved in cell wall biosynthesis
VAKKGYDDLLSALAALPADCAWQLTHIGGGPLLKALRQQADALGIASRISWLGALPQQQVLESYRNSDLFVLASKIVDDGDRDGLPNVLMEAQSQGLCCLSTEISGIPELIRHQHTGWLVSPGDVPALSKALQHLIQDPALRTRLGQAGQQRVRQTFDIERGIDQLAELFDLPAAGSPRSTAAQPVAHPCHCDH